MIQGMNVQKNHIPIYYQTHVIIKSAEPNIKSMIEKIFFHIPLVEEVHLKMA
jgi:hypothetical protein